MYGSTYCERTRRVTRGCPAPSTVETESLISDDPEQSAASERLRVGLTLNLENIKRQQNNFTDTNQGTGAGVHDSLSIALAECLVEEVTVVPGKVVASKGLSTVLVDTLENLECCQTKSCADSTRHLTLYAAAYPRPGNREMNRPPTEALAASLKTTLFRCAADSILPTLLIRRLAVVSTGWKTMSSARPAHPAHC